MLKYRWPRKNMHKIDHGLINNCILLKVTFSSSPILQRASNGYWYKMMIRLLMKMDLIYYWKIQIHQLLKRIALQKWSPIKLFKGLEIEIIISLKLIDVIENYIHLEKRSPNDDSTKNDSLDYYPSFCGGACTLLSLKTAEKTLEGNVWLIHHRLHTIDYIHRLCDTESYDTFKQESYWLTQSRLIFWEIILSQTESCQENKFWFAYQWRCFIYGHNPKQSEFIDT